MLAFLSEIILLLIKQYLRVVCIRDVLEEVITNRSFLLVTPYLYSPLIRPMASFWLLYTMLSGVVVGITVASFLGC